MNYTHVVCPTITAYDPHAYRAQIERVASFADRIHIDLMDGVFAPSVSPRIDRVWWPHEIRADLHIMYQKPDQLLDKLIHLKPNLVVIHAESNVDHMRFAAELHREGIRIGLALLQKTSVAKVEQFLHSFDHVLIFSGDLGYHGGSAELRLLEKVYQVRELVPDVEIGWDGGINLENYNELVAGGVDVLNVGSAIQKVENPHEVYSKMAS